MASSSITGNTKYDAQSRLDSIGYHIEELRSLIDASEFGVAEKPAAPAPAAAGSYEDAVLCALAVSVLDDLGITGRDTAERVRRGRDLLTPLIAEYRRGTAESVPGDVQAYPDADELSGFTPDEDDDLFSMEDLSEEDEELGVAPMETYDAADAEVHSAA